MNSNLIKNYFKDIFSFSLKDNFFLYNLRTIAVMMVIGAHVFNVSKSLAIDRLYILSKTFEFSVDILFVLAGFFSSTYFFKNGLNKKSVYHFFIQRVIKILPIYFFAFFVYYSVIEKEYKKLLEITKFYNTNEINHLLVIFKTKLDYFWGDLFFISNYMPDRIINVGWNISAIVQCYLVLIFLMWLANQNKNISRLYFWAFVYLLVTIIRFSYYYIDLEKIFFYTHTRLDSFIVGVIVAEILNNEGLKDKLKNILNNKIINYLLYAFFIISFYIIIIFYDQNFTFWNYVIRFNYNNLFLLVIIIYVYFLKDDLFLHKLLNFPYFTFLSKMSYTLFLLHEFFSIMLLKNYSFQFNNEFDVWKFYFVLLIFSFIMGYFFYMIFEQPFLILKRNIKINK